MRFCSTPESFWNPVIIPTGAKIVEAPEIVLLHKTADLIVTTSGMRENAM
jgi:hypothetical protein